MSELTQIERRTLFSYMVDDIRDRHFSAVSPWEHNKDKKRLWWRDAQKLFSAYQKLGGKKTYNQIIGIPK